LVSIDIPKYQCDYILEYFRGYKPGDEYLITAPKRLIKDVIEHFVNEILKSGGYKTEEIDGYLEVYG